MVRGGPGTVDLGGPIELVGPAVGPRQGTILVESGGPRSVGGIGNGDWRGGTVARRQGTL